MLAIILSELRKKSTDNPSDEDLCFLTSLVQLFFMFERQLNFPAINQIIEFICNLVVL